MYVHKLNICYHTNIKSYINKNMNEQKLEIPRMIKKGNAWFSYLRDGDHVIKLGGVDSVGYSHLTEHMSETIAKFELESYLNRGWK